MQVHLYVSLCSNEDDTFTAIRFSNSISKALCYLTSLPCSFSFGRIYQLQVDSILFLGTHRHIIPICFLLSHRKQHQYYYLYPEAFIPFFFGAVSIPSETTLHHGHPPFHSPREAAGALQDTMPRCALGGTCGKEKGIYDSEHKSSSQQHSLELIQICVYVRDSTLIRNTLQ